MAEEQGVRAELQEVYARLKRALEERDLPGFMALLATPESPVRELDGTLTTRAQFEAGLAAFFATMESLPEFAVSFEQLEVAGDTATVTYRERSAAIVRDPAGRRRVRRAAGRERATWVRTGDGWLAVFAERLERAINYDDLDDLDDCKED